MDIKKIVKKIVVAKRGSLEDFVTKNSDKISKKERKDITKALTKAGMDGNGRFFKIDHAISSLHEILDSEGLEIDDIMSSDIFRNDSGKKLIDIARKTNDPFAPIPIKNSAISFSWHLLGNESEPKSNRKYEILAYLS